MSDIDTVEITQDRINSLLMEIEAQGGLHLTSTCVSSSLEKAYTGPARKNAKTQGCGHQLKVAVYTGDAPIGACVICDRVDLWPRFEEK